ncbi:MAG TPA: arylesterase [Burkholderiales bacterium]|nr:arylesterase [Burkholderiales bacterium]
MTRVFWLALALLLPAAAAAAPAILVYGDSLSAGYGIAQDRGWVALLEGRLKREGFDYSVVNASISGEITRGGLERLPQALARTHPAVLILELGANDGLRGLAIAQMKANLGRMIELAKKARARVLLVGMKLPPNYGPDYTRAFESAFGELARRYRVALVPFLLQGIAQDEALFQPDGLHPSAAVQPVLLDNVWPALGPLLR